MNVNTGLSLLLKINYLIIKCLIFIFNKMALTLMDVGSLKLSNSEASFSVLIRYYFMINSVLVRT